MATRSVSRAAKAQSRSQLSAESAGYAGPPRPDDPSTWPVVWRVVSPAAGSYNQDLVYVETESEAEARRQYAMVREAKFPARLERVSCGPLPKKAATDIKVLRKGNAQNPGSEMPKILGRWEAQP